MKRRKEDILRLRAKGYTYNQIVEELGCSKGTVSFHCSTYKKPVYEEGKPDCKICGKDVPTRRHIYCSHSCYIKGVHLKREDKLKNGELVSAHTMKLAFKTMSLYACSECGNKGNWNGKELSLQVDHIDGNSDNNAFENLRILCPNCHSQTETYGYKGRTKKTKRNKYLRKYKS